VAEQIGSDSKRSTETVNIEEISVQITKYENLVTWTCRKNGTTDARSK
jgi:hypothetical protein